MQANSECVRCGKTRVMSKSWSEEVGSSKITYMLTVCPDSDCQKIVEEQLQIKKDKINAIQNESLKRRANIRRTKRPKK